MMFDPAIVELLEDESDRDRFDKILMHCELRYPGTYFGGLDDLKICWIEQGRMFKISEYDGSETIEFNDDSSWIVA